MMKKFFLTLSGAVLFSASLMATTPETDGEANYREFLGKARECLLQGGSPSEVEACLNDINEEYLGEDYQKCYNTASNAQSNERKDCQSMWKTERSDCRKGPSGNQCRREARSNFTTCYNSAERTFQFSVNACKSVNDTDRKAGAIVNKTLDTAKSIFTKKEEKR